MIISNGHNYWELLSHDQDYIIYRKSPFRCTACYWNIRMWCEYKSEEFNRSCYRCSGTASLHRLVGHNLGLSIYVAWQYRTMESCIPHKLNKLHCWSTLVKDFMHSVSNYSHYSLLKWHHKVHCNLYWTL